MKKEISGVLPVGAPWGGPESIRFVSCSSSLYMHLKQPNEFEDELYCNRSEKLCDRCGRLYDIELGDLGGLEARIRGITDFTVTGYQVYITGICQNCAEKH